MDGINMEVEITTLKEQLKILHTRMDKVEENVVEIQKLSTEIALLAKTIDVMSDNVKEIKSKVAKIEQEPADDLKRYKREIVLMVLGSVIGFMLGKLFALF